MDRKRDVQLLINIVHYGPLTTHVLEMDLVWRLERVSRVFVLQDLEGHCVKQVRIYSAFLASIEARVLP